MKRILIILGVVSAAILAIVALKFSPATSSLIWSASSGGAWLLPLVLIAAILDSVHPCSFSILLITIAFLFGMQMERRKILAIGGVYVAGIFAAYFLIGLGILQVLHLFATPHFMGKLGATLLIVFGIINLLNEFVPSASRRIPILRLRIPAVSHTAMGRLMEKMTIPAAFLLGALVGICQFPCMGGPYLMVIGLLRDTETYFAGFGYLLLYNLILIVPLVAVLFVAADKSVLEKVQEWKRVNIGSFRLVAGTAMILLGALILLF